MPDDYVNYSEAMRLIRAMIARSERLGDALVLTEEDLAASEHLEAEIVQADGVPPASTKWRRIMLRRKRDPRRDAITRAVARTLAQDRGAVLDVDQDALTDSILEELDRCEQ